VNRNTPTKEMLSDMAFILQRSEFIRGEGVAGEFLASHDLFLPKHARGLLTPKVAVRTLFHTLLPE